MSIRASFKPVYMCPNALILHENQLNQEIYRNNSQWKFQLNPPMTARVKISQNVAILAKVYLVHLKVKHCQTSRVVSIHLQVKMSRPF